MPLQRLALPLLSSLLLFHAAHAQSIGTFNSVHPEPQDQQLHIPETHHFQLLIQARDTLPASSETMPINADFSGYVPIGGSSELGFLAVNSESAPGGVTILDITFDTLSRTWELTAGEKVDFSALGNPSVFGTVANCSGGLTPWQTVITCEENETGGDLTGDGYMDWGWAIEIDPATRTVMDQNNDGNPDKLWALGRFKHENAAVATDSVTVYQGEDNADHGFLYKFVADAPGDLSSGNLYVLAANFSAGSGNWIQIPNVSKTDRNNTVSLSSAAGGTLFNRIEDVEIGPDGRIYFASTGTGRIWRLEDHGSTVSNLEIFIESKPYAINYSGGTDSILFMAPDNLAFDCEGNLWILQDGGDRHIWVAGPTHSTTNPDIRIFANTPLGSEPTGITFSPDCRFLFMSIQHPDTGNSETVTDAAGQQVIFHQHSTIVIGRSEVLGFPISISPPTTSQPTFKVFPNPSENVLNLLLDGEKSGKGTVEILDWEGRKIAETRVNIGPGESVLQLDISNLAAGIYLIQITQQGKIQSRKFIKH